MSIENYFCKDCTKYCVCTRVKIIEKFSEEAKKPLGIDISLITCDEYELVQNDH